VPFLVLVPLWDKFPPRVPIHWGLSGQPNGWADKGCGLVLLPLTNVFMVALLALVPRLDSRLARSGAETRESMGRTLHVLRLAVSAFISATALMVDFIALGGKLDVLRVTAVGMLILFAITGNYLPRLRPNRFVGIRTSWTLRSPEVWTRTHRLFGRLQFIGSLLLLLPSLVLPSAAAVVLLTVFILFTAVGAAIYSYVCFHSLERSGAMP
jgi:uncharacterized membrane protein